MCFIGLSTQLSFFNVLVPLFNNHDSLFPPSLFMGRTHSQSSKILSYMHAHTSPSFPLSTLVSFFSPTPTFKYNLRLKIDAVYCSSSYTGNLLPSSARILKLLVTIINNMKKNTARLYIFKHQSESVFKDFHNFFSLA